jgi:hypothetical protein
VQVVITDPAQFRIEKARLEDEMNAAAKRGRSAGDLNRAGGREAGRGAFNYEILECPNSLFVERIIISTEAIDGSLDSSTDQISERLMFYLVGYTQGLEQGIAGTVP